MGDDLKNLGKRGGWLNTLTKPKPTRAQDIDSNVVTRYGAVNSTDVEEMRRMVALDGQNLDLKDMLAFTLYSQDRIDEAMEVYKQLLNQRHQPAMQRMNIGNCYYKKKLYHLAVKEWEWVLRMEDATPDVIQKAKDRIQKIKQGLSVNFDGRY